MILEGLYFSVSAFRAAFAARVRPLELFRHPDLWIISEGVVYPDPVCVKAGLPPRRSARYAAPATSNWFFGRVPMISTDACSAGM